MPPTHSTTATSQTLPTPPPTQVHPYFSCNFFLKSHISSNKKPQQPKYNTRKKPTVHQHPNHSKSMHSMQKVYNFLSFKSLGVF